MNRLSLFLITAILLIGCGDDSSSESIVAPDKITEDVTVSTFYDLGDCDDANPGEIKYVLTESAYYVCSDQWYREDRGPSSSSIASSDSFKEEFYSSSSSESSSSVEESSSSKEESSSSVEEPSSSSKDPYLNEAKTMLFALTSYKQISKNWDALDNAGDPSISFVVKTYSEESLINSLTTKTLLKKDDIRSWEGSATTTLTIDSGIDKIEICAKVIDIDPLDNDDYSSGYCASQEDIGYLEDYELVKQSDDEGKDYALTWEWELY